MSNVSFLPSAAGFELFSASSSSDQRDALDLGVEGNPQFNSLQVYDFSADSIMTDYFNPQFEEGISIFGNTIFDGVSDGTVQFNIGAYFLGADVAFSGGTAIEFPDSSLVTAAGFSFGEDSLVTFPDGTEADWAGLRFADSVTFNGYSEFSNGVDVYGGAIFYDTISSSGVLWVDGMLMTSSLPAADPGNPGQIYHVDGDLKVSLS
jgi:hypothetical protein